MNRLTNKNINWYEDFVFSMRNRLITENEIKDSIYNRLKLLEDLGIDLFKTLIKVKRSDLLILNMKGNYENDK